MSSKAEIRETMLKKRREMGASERDKACGYVCDQLGGLKLASSAVVAGYSAISQEVDILQALKAFHARKNPVCLPVVTQPERVLRFKKWSPGDPLIAGAHNTSEPASGELMIPDIVLVPLVAFDAQGYRIGYGAGYYDATIAHLRKIKPEMVAIGVAYSFQRVVRVPHEAHDMRLNVIVTEKETVVVN